MTPVEQTLILLGIMIGVLLIGVGLMKGLIWLWEKLRALGAPAAAGAAAIVLIVAVNGATPQQEAIARQQVDQLRAQGIEATVVTIDEDDARRIVEEARREGLVVETHDPTPASAHPTDDVIVIWGEEDAIDDLDVQSDDDEGFWTDDEREYEEAERHGFVSAMDW